MGNLKTIEKVGQGRWRLVRVGDQDYSAKGLTIDIKGSKVTISNVSGVFDTYKMSHSPWRLQEPMTLHVDPEASKIYPWMGNGHYGVINDTLYLEIDVNNNSKFVR